MVGADATVFVSWCGGQKRGFSFCIMVLGNDCWRQIEGAKKSKQWNNTETGVTTQIHVFCRDACGTARYKTC